MLLRSRNRVGTSAGDVSTSLRHAGYALQTGKIAPKKGYLVEIRRGTPPAVRFCTAWPVQQDEYADKYAGDYAVVCTDARSVSVFLALTDRPSSATSTSTVSPSTT
ncbi:hypothetical protein GCM10027298_00400 [Epidermidibacterium keratini]